MHFWGNEFAKQRRLHVSVIINKTIATNETTSNHHADNLCMDQ